VKTLEDISRARPAAKTIRALRIPSKTDKRREIPDNETLGWQPLRGIVGGPTCRRTTVPGAPRNIAATSSESMLTDTGLSSISYILSPSFSPFNAAGEPAVTALILAEAKLCSSEGGGHVENDTRPATLSIAMRWPVAANHVAENMSLFHTHIHFPWKVQSTGGGGVVSPYHGTVTPRTQPGLTRIHTEISGFELSDLNKNDLILEK